MMLFVGLGNPGEKYEKNRHNVGFQFLDYLIDQYQKSNIKDQKHNLKIKNDKYLSSTTYELTPDLILVKPSTFMNKSGIAVKKLIENFKLKIENLIIVHDDLDIPFGKFHIQVGVGPQLHNGIESVENHLKAKDFLRIRIGVDNRVPEVKTGPEQSRRVPGEAYVLSDFTPDEFSKLNTEIFPMILAQLKLSHQIS